MTFNVAVNSNGGGSRKYQEKTFDLPQITDKLYRIMLYWSVHLVWKGFELTTLVVIGTECIGSYKSNHHTIMATTAPSWCLHLRSMNNTKQTITSYRISSKGHIRLWLFVFLWFGKWGFARKMVRVACYYYQSSLSVFQLWSSRRTRVAQWIR
jgi:hypothetical protein